VCPGREWHRCHDRARTRLSAEPIAGARERRASRRARPDRRHAAPRRRVMKTMPEKIRFVDDDPSILSAFMRLLRHETLIRDYPSLTPFVVETAPGGRYALAAMRARAPYAVIVSDLRMPEMDGVQLLEDARTVSPSSVRILLTGQ